MWTWISSVVAPIVRSAEQRDCARLAELIRQLGYGTTVSEVGERLAIMAQEDRHVLVAELGAPDSGLTNKLL
jgi:hypothetical protein